MTFDEMMKMVKAHAAGRDLKKYKLRNTDVKFSESGENDIEVKFDDANRTISITNKPLSSS